MNIWKNPVFKVCFSTVNGNIVSDSSVNDSIYDFE